MPLNSKFVCSHNEKQNKATLVQWRISFKRTLVYFDEFAWLSLLLQYDFKFFFLSVSVRTGINLSITLGRLRMDLLRFLRPRRGNDQQAERGHCPSGVRCKSTRSLHEALWRSVLEASRQPVAATMPLVEADWREWSARRWLCRLLDILKLDSKGAMYDVMGSRCFDWDRSQWFPCRSSRPAVAKMTSYIRWCKFHSYYGNDDTGELFARKAAVCPTNFYNEMNYVKLIPIIRFMTRVGHLLSKQGFLLMILAKHSKTLLQDLLKSANETHNQWMIIVLSHILSVMSMMCRMVAKQDHVRIKHL